MILAGPLAARSRLGGGRLIESHDEATPANGLHADGEPHEVFVVVSFEGPDRYAQVGGLATRVSGLAEALAAAGHETHLVFIGDPCAPGEEYRLDGKLVIH